MAILLSSSSLPSLPNTKLCISRDASAERSSTITTFPGLNRKNNKKCSIVCLSVKGNAKVKKFDVIDGNNSRKSGVNVVLSEGRDEDENHGLVCPGCGVYMQDNDPNLPGFFKKRKVVVDEEEIEGFGDEIEGFIDGEEEGFGGEIEGGFDGEEKEDGSVDEIEGSLEMIDGDMEDDGFDWDSEDWEDEDLEALDGFQPVGVGYGNVTEELVKEKAEKRKKLSKSERKRLAREAEKEREEVTVCARCHSLRNYGQVKNQMAENLIPDFDFDRSLFKALEGKQDGKFSKKLPKLVLVATKVDLLPSEISPTRLDRWVRHRAKAAGAPKLNAVYLVSSRKDLGVRNLLSFIKESAGPRGHVWVIGAQNAGKSTLINTFAKKEGAKVTKLTEAAVPGTTLGILRVGGVLSGKAKMYDTPGLLHAYLMSMRLSREEQKMIEIRKELRPRSYRIKASSVHLNAGQTIHVGGLVRLDLVQASVQTIYVTVWASPNVSLHLGKTENADETWSKHVGIRLQPPVGADRLPEMGTWSEREFKVTGTSWDVNSSDLAVAGLGWLALGLKGEATLKLWTYDTVEVVLREPLALDRAPYLERPGFWLPQAISDALGNQSKLEAQKKQRLEDESEYVTA
uniref:Uncharacterized protein n=1 Tax=Chenopodium quinoa TaxID=63459 RepID=A0A803MAM5_CHEQI